ncbi:MAG: hypothetical protein N4A68_15550, partial [Maledivibacter sp.]|nr:hypothetical protein [Maledivibacter sp.]
MSEILSQVELGKVTIESNQIIITWEAVPGATGYDIEIDGKIVNHGSSTIFSHKELQANTQYSYRIRAKNDNGVGEWSDLIRATTLPDNAIVITTKEELKQISNDMTALYVLGNDIDLENEEWEPIGSSSVAFSGEFDGRGYKIKNLKVNKERESYIGLFGYINGAKIKNLKIENADIKGVSYVGSLVGQAENSCNISNCTVEGKGKIKGIGSDIGGLIGRCYGVYGKIENCSAKIRVEGSGSIMGGLVGSIDESDVFKCYSTGDVIGTSSRIGGLIGYANAGENNVIITESYGLGNASGLDKVGGLIGEVRSYNHRKITVEDCFALGNVTSSETNRSYAGGLIGELDGDSDNYKSIVRNSYST